MSFDNRKIAAEVVKKKGVKAALNELLAMGCPYLFLYAAADDGTKTDYVIEYISPGVQGIELTTDHFPDILNVMNGFKTVYNENWATAGVRGLKSIEGKDIPGFYDSVDRAAYPDVNINVNEIEDEPGDIPAKDDVPARNADKENAAGRAGGQAGSGAQEEPLSISIARPHKEEEADWNQVWQEIETAHKKIRQNKK